MKKLLYLLLSLASFTGLRAQQLVGYLAYQQVSAPGAPSAGVTTYADTSNAFHFVAPSGSFPALVLGTPGYTDTGMFIAQLTVPSAAQGNTYAQFSIQGQNSGNAASTDFVATADNGTSSAHYVDLGINSSTNSTGVFPAGANLAFLESASDALYVGTVGAQSLHLFTNSADAMVIASGGAITLGGASSVTAANNTDLTLNAGSGTGNKVVVVNSPYTATSGTFQAFSVTPTYNQVSGTAANTDLLVNRTQTAVGSGTQRLLDLQVGSATQLNVDTSGNVVAQGNVTAGQFIGIGGNTVYLKTTGTNPVILQTNSLTALTLSSSQNATFAGSVLSSSASGGVGYGAGAGAAVTQATNRSTGVTINATTGQITGNGASLAALASATFTVTNSAVALHDVIVLSVQSGPTNPTTKFDVSTVAAGSFNITIYNSNVTTADTGAPIINFAVIKGSSS